MANEVYIGNIAELRQFGKNLNQASGALNTLFHQLSQQMNRACGTWQDKQAQKFMAEFNQKRADVDKISQIMSEYSKFIEGYCQKADALQNHR